MGRSVGGPVRAPPAESLLAVAAQWACCCSRPGDIGVERRHRATHRMVRTCLHRSSFVEEWSSHCEPLRARPTARSCGGVALVRAVGGYRDEAHNLARWGQAPVAQGIERRFPKPQTEVRFLPGALVRPPVSQRCAVSSPLGGCDARYVLRTASPDRARADSRRWLRSPPPATVRPRSPRPRTPRSLSTRLPTSTHRARRRERSPNDDQQGMSV